MAGQAADDDQAAADAEQNPCVNLVEQAAAERQPDKHDVRIHGHEQGHLGHVGLAIRSDQAEGHGHRREIVAHHVEHETHAASHHHADADEDQPGAMEPLLFFSHFFTFPLMLRNEHENESSASPLRSLALPQPFAPTPSRGLPAFCSDLGETAWGEGSYPWENWAARVIGRRKRGISLGSDLGGRRWFSAGALPWHTLFKPRRPASCAPARSPPGHRRRARRPRSHCGNRPAA